VDKIVLKGDTVDEEQRAHGSLTGKSGTTHKRKPAVLTGLLPTSIIYLMPSEEKQGSTHTSSPGE